MQLLHGPARTRVSFDELNLVSHTGADLGDGRCPARAWVVVAEHVRSYIYRETGADALINVPGIRVHTATEAMMWLLEKFFLHAGRQYRRGAARRLARCVRRDGYRSYVDSIVRRRVWVLTHTDRAGRLRNQCRLA